MKVGVIGAGYVGAVTSANLAEGGHDVTCVDINQEKVDQWNSGNPPIYEPGLAELVENGLRKKHLRFTSDSSVAIAGAEVVFIAVGTPQAEDDSADLSYVLKAAQDIGTYATGRLVAVDKSTVPIGTSVWVREEIARVTDHDIPVVSNPEFLREGSALKDVSNPHQIIVGTDSEYAASVMRRLYAQDIRRNPDVLDIMDPASAETVKYGINAFLSVKISYANELAQLCKAAGADYGRVRMAVGRDPRIGSL